MIGRSSRHNPSFNFIEQPITRPAMHFAESKCACWDVYELDTEREVGHIVLQCVVNIAFRIFEFRVSREINTKRSLGDIVV